MPQFKPAEMALPTSATVTTMTRLLGLAFLMVVNWLLFGLVVWTVPLWLQLIDGTPLQSAWMQLLGNMCEGILVAQVLLIGYWCALAPERLGVRLLVGILLAGLLMVIRFSIWLIVSANGTGKYCGLALIAFFLLQALRPWFDWSLVWDRRPHIPPSRQFRIFDLLVWTTAMAIPLGLLHAIFGAMAPKVALNTAAAFATDLPVTFPLLYWAIRPGRSIRWLIALPLWALLWPGCMVLLAHGYFYLNSGPGQQWSQGIDLMLLEISPAYYLPLVLVFMGNLLALGKIGLRPANIAVPQSTMAPRHSPGS